MNMQSFKDFEKHIKMSLKLISVIILIVFVFESSKDYLMKLNFSEKLNKKTDIILTLNIDNEIIEYPEHVKVVLNEFLKRGMKLNIHISAYYYDYLDSESEAIIEKGIENGNFDIIGGTYSNVLMTSLDSENLKDQFRLNREYYKEKLGIDIKDVYIGDRVFNRDKLKYSDEKLFISDGLIKRRVREWKNKYIVEGYGFYKKRFAMGIRGDEKSDRVPAYEFEKAIYLSNILGKRSVLMAGDFNEIFIYGADEKKLDTMKRVRKVPIKLEKLKENINFFFDLIEDREWMEFKKLSSLDFKKVKQIEKENDFENDNFSRIFRTVYEGDQVKRYDNFADFAYRSHLYTINNALMDKIYEKVKKDREFLEYFLRAQDGFSFRGDYEEIANHDFTFISRIKELKDNGNDTAYLKDIGRGNDDEVLVKNGDNIYIFSLSEGGKLLYWYNVNKGFIIEQFSKRHFAFTEEKSEYDSENFLEKSKFDFFRHRVAVEIGFDDITIRSKEGNIKRIRFLDNGLKIDYEIEAKYDKINIESENYNGGFVMIPENGEVENGGSLDLILEDERVAKVK